LLLFAVSSRCLMLIVVSGYG